MRAQPKMSRQAQTPEVLRTQHDEGAAVFLASIDVHGPGQKMCRGTSTSKGALSTMLGRAANWLYTPTGSPPVQRAVRLGLRLRVPMGNMAADKQKSAAALRLSSCSCPTKACLYNFSESELEMLMTEWGAADSRQAQRELLWKVAVWHPTACDDAIRQVAGNAPTHNFVKVSRERLRWEEYKPTHGNLGSTSRNRMSVEAELAIRETVDIYTVCDPSANRSGPNNNFLLKDRRKINILNMFGAH